MVTISKEERERRYDIVRNSRRFKAGDLFTQAEIVNDTGIGRWMMKNILIAMVRDGELDCIPGEKDPSGHIYESRSNRYRRPNPNILSIPWRKSEEAYDLIAEENYAALIKACEEAW